MRMMEEGFGEAVTPLLGKALAPVVLHFGFNTRATEKKQPSHCLDLLVFARRAPFHEGRPNLSLSASFTSVCIASSFYCIYCFYLRMCFLALLLFDLLCTFGLLPL